MLQRPEISTREHILLWLASKPADETFYWPNAATCACAQYEQEHGLSRNWCGPLAELNDIGGAVHHRKFGVGQRRLMNYSRGPLSHGDTLRFFPTITFGELYEAARAHWDRSKLLDLSAMPVILNVPRGMLREVV